MTGVGHPPQFPGAAGLLFGLGLGGFFDGIVSIRFNGITC